MYLQKFKKIENSNKILINYVHLNKLLYFKLKYNDNNFIYYIFKLNLNLFNYFIFKNNCFLYFKKINIFKTIFNLFYLKIKDLIKGFFIELELKGLGYTVFLYKNYLFFDLNYSHFIALKFNKNIIIKRLKNKLVLFSFNRLDAMMFAKEILNLKKLDIYKGKGIFIKGKTLKLKEIKKK